MLQRDSSFLPQDTPNSFKSIKLIKYQIQNLFLSLNESKNSQKMINDQNENKIERCDYTWDGNYFAKNVIRNT